MKLQTSARQRAREPWRPVCVAQHATNSAICWGWYLYPGCHRCQRKCLRTVSRYWLPTSRLVLEIMHQTRTAALFETNIFAKDAIAAGASAQVCSCASRYCLLSQGQYQKQCITHMMRLLLGLIPLQRLPLQMLKNCFAILPTSRLVPKEASSHEQVAGGGGFWQRWCYGNGSGCKVEVNRC